MNIRDDQRLDSHRAILQSARDLIRTQGIAGTRVVDVMKGVGLTVGGFYAHFASKQDLVDQALRAAGTDLMSRFFAGLEQVPSAERAKRAVERYLSVAHRDTPSCPFPAVVGEIGTTAPEHAPALAERVEALAARLGELLPRAGKASLRARSLALVALMYGGLSMARALKGSPVSEEILAACRELAGTFIDGGSEQ